MKAATVMIATYVLGAPFVLHASELCSRLPMDLEFPAGLVGSYEVIGKDPITHAAYRGDMEIEAGADAYALARIVDGKPAKGHAWIEQCGPDKIRELVVEYAIEPTERARCRLGADADNYYRVTCRTEAGRNSRSGLEAWFQRHDLAR